MMMWRKSTLRDLTIAIFVVTIFASLLGCERSDTEGAAEQIRFAEFFVFPTAPYVDKSWTEKVPEDELAAGRDIDFEAEKASILDACRNFAKTTNEKDINALKETLDIAVGLEYHFFIPDLPPCIFVDATNYSSGWNSIKITLEGQWDWCAEPTFKNPFEVEELYIRPKNVRVFWDEASAKLRYGTQYYHFYLTKKNNKWLIHQFGEPLYLSKYFTDKRYKAPSEN